MRDPKHVVNVLSKKGRFHWRPIENSDSMVSDYGGRSKLNIYYFSLIFEMEGNAVSLNSPLAFYQK